MGNDDKDIKLLHQEEGTHSPLASSRGKKKTILRSLSNLSTKRFHRARSAKKLTASDAKSAGATGSADCKGKKTIARTKSFGPRAPPKVKKPIVRTKSFGASLGSGTVTDCSQQLVFFNTPSEGLQLAKYEDTDQESSESTQPVDSEAGSDELDISSKQDFSSLSDAELLKGLEAAVDYEKHVLVAQYLQEMEHRNLSLEDPKRQASLKQACKQVQEVIDSHSQDAADKQSGWKKQGLMHGKQRNTMVYHRTNKDGELTVRCETPIQAALVSPLLAILNETDLYTTWCPSFQRPFKLGVSDTGRHKQCSRASQIAYAKVDMPWPMNNREVIVKNVMAEAVDEIGALVVRAKTMEDGEEEEGFTVPPCESGWDRIKMDAGLLLTRCPDDHPALKKKQKEQQETSEPMVLATFTLFVTPSVNAVLKVIAGPMWGALIGFANEVEGGKNGEKHRQRIQEKPELYGWVNDTVKRMIETCK